MSYFEAQPDIEEYLFEKLDDLLKEWSHKKMVMSESNLFLLNFDIADEYDFYRFDDFEILAKYDKETYYRIMCELCELYNYYDSSYSANGDCIVMDYKAYFLERYPAEFARAKSKVKPKLAEVTK